jgi:thiol-disulfide isomerase/thioredoxin
MILLAVVCASSTSSESSTVCNDRYEVVIFMAPHCKICQYYALPLRTMYAEYADKGFTFVGVFPNNHSTITAIEEFKSKYEIPFALVKDLNNRTGQLGASVTPEVFILEGNEVVYSGRIDNSYVRVGKKRTITTSFDLQDALAALANNQPLEVNHTTAVGCLIENK